MAEAFEKDQASLKKIGFNLEIDIRQPGYIRAIISREGEATKIQWAHDSAWRFLPTLFLEDRGFVLHPIDLAINKVLALVGRDEPRDFLDVHLAHKTILPLAALCA